MGALSGRMADAARANDWDQLVQLEKSVRMLRFSLEALPAANDLLSSAEIELKRSLIQKILDDDAEVRRHTEPRMEHLRQFLGARRQHRRIEKAYASPL
ncbi:MAG: flagellar protein FliT [Proteobacteria bacterium]|nr:flagellar protein FliT [Pseudomonadota bacterium]